MKTLSVRQPWAWLIVNGYKNIENRTWYTKHRGRVLIHAGLKMDYSAFEGDPAYRRLLPWIRHLIGFEGNDAWEQGFTPTMLGAIVGEAHIDDVRPASWSPWYTPGNLAFQLSNAVAYEKPLSYRGRLGLFDVPRELVETPA